jgi:diguanylate cyclase (GGDEF)-like protein
MNNELKKKMHPPAKLVIETIATKTHELRSATEIFLSILLLAILTHLIAPYLEKWFPYYKITALGLTNLEWWGINILALCAAPLLYYRALNRYKTLSATLWNLANTDYLTGLYNRRYLIEAMNREFEIVGRFPGEYSAAFLMIDIDNFKRINDTYGHSTGDEVLKFVSKILQTKTRTYCVSSRYGGEEFAQLIPKSDVEGTNVAAQHLLETIANSRETFGTDSVIQVTVSIGISIIPNGSANVNEWLDRADNAMYQSKSNGKNRITYIP